MKEKKDGERNILFEAKEIHKVFGPTVALNHVDLSVYSGEIRGLIGENGSGKSTLSSIVAGMQQPDSGEMYFRGKSYKPTSMIEGLKLGVGMIVQEAGTVLGITIAQNIFLGHENKFSRFGFIDSKAMNKAAKEALENIGVTDIEPTMLVDQLNIQDRKLIEIAKVMYENPDILIVDETTTAISQRGRSIIYNIMKKMKGEGKAVLFISHDLEETMEHCDTLTVLRDGNLIATVAQEEFESSKIKKYMVGREIGERYYREDNICTYDDEVIIEVKQLTTGHGLTQNIDLELHKGEILGIGGLSHCGMHELGRAIFGEEPIVTGHVKHVPSGEKITNARVAIKHGMGYVSKNRDAEALVLTSSIRDNIVGTGFDKVQGSFGIISKKTEESYVDEQVKSLRIKSASIDQDVKYLSGGNKQKVVFGKWLARDSKILILDCPTRGVDIGVKAAMYQLIEDMKNNGYSILIISEEITELIGMCDRLLVLKDGKLQGELKRGIDMNENNIIELMI